METIATRGIKLYDLNLCDGESGRCRADMIENPVGEYALWGEVDEALASLDEELEHAHAEIARLKAENERLEDVLLRVAHNALSISDKINNTGADWIDVDEAVLAIEKMALTAAVSKGPEKPK